MKKSKNIIAGAMLSLGAAFSFSEVQAQTCVMPPSCEELGYKQTEADCKGLDVVLKCPTDMSKMACLGSSVSQDVSLGSILYGDGTVASGLIAGKKPIGIVFDVINRLALALTDVKQDGSAGSGTMPWSSGYCDTPNLENCTDWSTIPISCGLDGRANTDAILASTCNGTTYAANAVNAYQTSNCSADFCQKGKWFLPSMRDLNTIYSFKSVINNSLTLLVSIGASKLAGSELTSIFYWSSTRYGNSYPWYLHMDRGTGYSNVLYNGSYYVRPVVKF